MPAPGWIRLLGQGLSFAVWRRPRSAPVQAGFGAFLAAWSLGLAVFVALDAAATPVPREFDANAFWVHAGVGFALLIAAWCSARFLGRPSTWLTLATWVAAAIVPWTVVSLGLDSQVSSQSRYDIAVRVLLAAILASIARMHWTLGSEASIVRRAIGSVLFSLVLVPALVARNDAWFWSTPDADDAPDVPAHAAPPPPRTTPASRAGQRASDPEILLGRQPAMVAADVARLAPQTPGHVDLYALGFAGDGNEPTFRNEVEFLGQLLPRRFGADGRTLQLINHPGTVARTPLATVANLRAALAGIGSRIDPDEDVVFLYLASHGSPDHYLAVDLPPLPLRQVHPADLRDALDDAGIHWRVIVVSACYSGGFIDALKDPRTLVITAARADRPSFGCGADSEVTWFGRAFLTQALNQTTDFREAYAIAARHVREREREQDELPSEPQAWAGALVDAKLAQWRAGVPGAPAVPFVPAVPVQAEPGTR